MVSASRASGMTVLQGPVTMERSVPSLLLRKNGSINQIVLILDQ